MNCDDHERNMQDFVIREYLSILQNPETKISERIAVLNTLSKIYSLTSDLEITLNCLQRYGLELTTESLRYLAGESETPVIEASRQDLKNMSTSELAREYKYNLY